ncbi:hypothetical protein BKA60DRAFT_577645 [Fusarium oxysporum]|nr:hypothetical protein BKA60DRAFT_577645 [Fusarium oxysporum]
MSTEFKKVCKHPSHLFHHNGYQQLPTATADGWKTSCFLRLSSGIHSQEDLNEIFFQGNGRNGSLQYRNHILPVGMVQMAEESRGKSPRVNDERMVGRIARISCENCWEDDECLKFRYSRSVFANGPANERPGHDWYHAISPESYSYAGPCGVPETCSDPSCRNYYSSGTRYEHAEYGRGGGGCHVLSREKR